MIYLLSKLNNGWMFLDSWDGGMLCLSAVDNVAGINRKRNTAGLMLKICTVFLATRNVF